EQGGAEQSLLRLVTADSELHHTVICVGAHTPLAQKMIDAGVSVHFVPASLPGLWRMRKLLAELAPDIVQGWMYYGNLLASLLTPRKSRNRVVWNVRSENRGQLSVRIRLCIWLAGFCRPATVIYNSVAGQRSHGRFAHLSSCVIQNGIDTELYRPDPLARKSTRATLQIDDRTCLIGLVGRFHADKGLHEFLNLALKLPAPEHQLVLVGRGMQPDNQALKSIMATVGVREDQVLLLGERNDLPALYPALDVLVVSSYREGLPNVLLEAMACGVAVAGTQVGDVARVIEDRARVCAAGDAEALAEVVGYTIARRGEFADRDRQRILDGYDSERCQQAYMQLYRHLADKIS
ncbi:MAG: glycosyltransferase, partial [Pseudomonadales bacterium]